MLLVARSALAYDRSPLLEGVAAHFAQRPAEIRRPSPEEWIGDPIWGTAPNPSRAWGYTDMVNEHIVFGVVVSVAAAPAKVDLPQVISWPRQTPLRHGPLPQESN